MAAGTLTLHLDPCGPVHIADAEAGPRMTCKCTRSIPAWAFSPAFPEEFKSPKLAPNLAPAPRRTPVPQKPGRGIPGKQFLENVDSRVAGKRFFQQHRALQRVCTRLGFGEQYLVDLVVTVPFSLAVQTVWTTGLP